MRKNLSKFLNKRIQVIAKVSRFGRRRAKKTLKMEKTIFLTNIKIINPLNNENEGYEEYMWIDYNKTFKDVEEGDIVVIEGHVRRYKKNNKYNKYSKPFKIKTVKINYSLYNTCLINILSTGVSR